MRNPDTWDIARAFAYDAGNKHMQEAGRTAWDESDFEVAVSVFADIYNEETDVEVIGGN
jgi:hypothetical protein